MRKDTYQQREENLRNPFWRYKTSSFYSLQSRLQEFLYQPDFDLHRDLLLFVLKAVARAHFVN